MQKVHLLCGETGGRLAAMAAHPDRQTNIPPAATRAVLAGRCEGCAVLLW